MTIAPTAGLALEQAKMRNRDLAELERRISAKLGREVGSTDMLCPLNMHWHAHYGTCTGADKDDPQA